MDINFPKPPQQMYMEHAYTSDGKSIPVETYPPQSQPHKSILGANFSNLVGGNVSVPITSPLTNVVTTTTDKKPVVKKKKKKDGEVEVVDSSDTKQTVENTVYADTYNDTNNLTYGIIAQSDELLRECKEDLDFIRSQRSMKGKYHYVNATMASMSSLLTTKLAAIKEINSNIKSANDMEYRRFKDMRAIDTADDNKAIMDAYSAFISAPVGAPVYQQPGTMNLTGGLNGVVRADYPDDIQAGMDAGFANYVANMTPEETIMLNDANQNMEEYIVYDPSTGARKFAWFDRNGNELPNIPPSSTLTLEDYSIDINTKLAKNINLNDIKKVKIINQDTFSRF